ncbi:MAG: bifunctional folylpolyglutamate synthase/dihydrofolate synthase [Bacteroidetes bacterium]|nr:bifunctional folylpolyglutamate synthase/dihydrofolate synthase [Bacteroidota bacterium]
MRTYSESLNYLYDQLPMFHRIGAAAYKADLKATMDFCRQLGNPQSGIKAIHVGGTNGKGSVSHMLSSIFQVCGYKTGLYTSPHLKDFRERIRINGKMIPKSYVTHFVNDKKDIVEELHLSFFEMVFGMALQYFKENQVDYGIFEVGMGGRLDSTNVVHPLISIITNISPDHTQFLGKTLKEIALEKAGIIKANIPVVIGESHPETDGVFKAAAKKVGAPLTFADSQFHLNTTGPSAPVTGNVLADVYFKDSLYLKDLECPLKGNYQQKNISTVLESIRVLAEAGLPIMTSQVSEGIRKVVLNTGFSGRWQVLRQKPLTICDTGHNLEGIRLITEQIKGINYKKLHFVLGMVNDKDIRGMLSLLPADARYYFCRANIPRGLDAVELSLLAREAGLMGTVYPSVGDAFRQALQMADDKDLVFIGGSTFVVAEVL